MGRPSQVIYNQQNRSLHKALDMMGMPYNEHKDELLAAFSEVLGRKRQIDGISSLTLGERHRIIKSLQAKGIRVMNPPVGKHMWRWRKGEPDMGVNTDPTPPPARFESNRPFYPMLAEKQPLVSKVHAILADLKLPWSYADGISLQMFGVKIVEHCSKAQLIKVVTALVVEQKKQFSKDRCLKAL
ncbi:MAG: hypothetical protein V1793_25050 [Pseudomonadota bacterium]